MATTDELEALRRTALGWTIACEEIAPGFELGRDIRLVSTPRGLDLARAEGMAALTQSLCIGLTTLFGDDVFNATFGFDGLNALAEEADPVMLRERVRIGVIKLLSRENRIRRIVDVNLTGDGRLEPPAAGLTPVGPEPDRFSRVLDVRVVFETVTGEQAAVSLGKAVVNG
jgi:hypothetical protein